MRETRPFSKILVLNKKRTPRFFVVCHFSELSLNDSDLQKLTLFEERCVDGYLREKDTLLHATQEEKIKVIGDRYVAQSHVSSNANEEKY